MRIGLGEGEEIYESGILTYQTTMRQSDELNVRDFISRKICISSVFSVGFFTMIFGFLLGKFVTSREYKIKELHNADKLQLVRELQSVHTALITSLQQIKLNETQLQHSELQNKKLWQELATCNQDYTETFSEKFEIFVEHLVENSVRLLIRCLEKLEIYVKKLSQTNHLTRKTRKNSHKRNDMRDTNLISKQQYHHQQQQHKQQQITATNHDVNRINEGTTPTTTTFLNGISHKNDHQSTHTTSTNMNSSQKTLNDWVENCLRDYSSTQPSSQSQQTALNDAYDNHNHSNNNYNSDMNSNKYMINSPPTVNLNGSSNSYSSTFPLPQFTNDYVNNYLNPGKHRKNFGFESTMNQDFTSLPPAVNLINSPRNVLELDLQDNNQKSFNDLLNAEFDKSRRFSDPGFGNNSDDNDDMKSVSDIEKKSYENTKPDNTKILTTLLEQIHILHETNSKICRNLHDTKVDVEALKHAPSWGLRHRRDSVSGLSTHSQPLNFNLGTQSPAPTYYSGMYTPGLLTDVVREVREAARVREEALLHRVKSLVDERAWSLNENNFRLIKEVEELKNQIIQLKAERKEVHQKMFQMESDIKSLKSLVAFSLNQSNKPNLSYQNNHNSQDKEYQQNKQSQRHVNGRNSKLTAKEINYGVINHDDGLYLQTVHENEVNNISSNSNGNTVDDLIRNQSGNGNLIFPLSPGRYNQNGDEVNGVSDIQIHQLEKDNLTLRRELQSARAVTNTSEQRIRSLEQIVLSLQKSKQNPETYSSNSSVVDDVGSKISFLKIVENTQPNHHTNNTNQNKHQHLDNHQTSAIQIQDVSPYHGERKTNIHHSGPVTDL